MIGRSVSHYKILERIGGGGMGVVYRAEDFKLRRTVALKFLPRELGGDEVAKKRFIREAQAASALDHPNICNIFEIDETPEGQLFIAMAYYKGESLKETIARGALDVREAFEIAMAMAQGLSRAHKNGIVHRDVKPANVMITEDGYVKIVDFGLAKLEGVTAVTRSQFTVGTVAYMSPEQAAGEHVDERTDVWALGVVMHEMLAGASPWQGGIDQAVIYSIMTQEPTPVRDLAPGVPEKLSDIILKCLAKDPKQRYQTVDDLIQDFGDVARELGWGSSVVARSVAPIMRKRPQKWPRVAAIAAATVVLVAGGIFAWQRWGPQAEHSVYVTENRIAVLPLTNMMGVAENDFSNGLSEVISFLTEEATREKQSTWVVPYDKIVAAPIAKPQDAIGAFGINQVVIGSLQRFADQRRLNLQLCNAQDLSVIRSANLDYDAQTHQGLSDSLAQRVASLLDVTTSTGLESYLPANSAAMGPYVEGLALLQGDPQGAQLDSAAAVLKTAVAEDPRFAPALAALGSAYMEQYRLSADGTKIADARESLQAAIAISPDNVYSNIYAGRMYVRLKLYPDAIARYQAALAAAPGHPTATVRLASVYNRQNRFDEAEAIFRDAIRRRPDYWDTRLELGYLFYSRDRLNDALSSWKAALQYAPNDVTTLNNIGAFYHLTGHWELATEYFERAFQISPNEDTCGNMGLSYYFRREYGEAVKYYRFALEYADTTQHQPWGNLAMAQYWAEGQRPQSIATFRTAIRHALREFRLRPEDPALITALIDYYTMSGDWEHGLPMIAYGDSLAGNDPDVLFAAGDAYERHGNRQLALRYLGRAIKHGKPAVEIENTPSLQELIEDPVFKQMTSEGSTEEDSRTSEASSNQTSEP